MASLENCVRELVEANLSLTELKNGSYMIKQELPELCEPALTEAKLWLRAYKQVVQDTLDTCLEAIADEETGRIQAELLYHQRDTLQQALDEIDAPLPAEDDGASVASSRSSVPWNEWCPASSAEDAALKVRDLEREVLWMFKNADFCQPGIWETYRNMEQELDTMKRWQEKLEWRKSQKEDVSEVLHADLARARRDYDALLMGSELEAPGISRALDNLKDTIEDLEREIDYRESSCSCCYAH